MSQQQGEDERRYVNWHRFSWHEKVIADAELRQYPTALALAGHIMHRYKSDAGCAEFSNESAARALSMDARSVNRAKKKLIDRGWIKLFDGRRRRSTGWSANRYRLAGGPDDLDLEQHIAVDDEGDTDAGVTGEGRP